MKKLISIILTAGMLLLAMAGCGKSSGESGEVTLLQFEAVSADQPIATIHVKDYGDIKIALYPEEAPKTVENFIGLAEEGYYDGVTFHRVIKDFMIQGGDPTGTGSGGHSLWNKEFEDEFSDNLYCFDGALCMANAGPNTNGSQFFIVQSSDPIQEDYFEQCIAYHEQQGRGRTSYADSVMEKYAEVGGTPHLDGMHTVFGQVIEGMDVVKAISSCEVTQGSDGADSKPVESVVIESITIENAD